MRFWHYHGEVRVTSEGKGMAEASGHELPVDGDALLNVWDHTGQDLVDLTHQVVYSHRAIFLFVFNLTHDLDKAAVFEVTGSNGQATEQHELTNLECMNLWMQTVHMYTSTANQFSQRTSPAIIVVGTHRGSLGRETTEQVAAKFSKIRDLLRDAPYRQHVMSRHFAVENSLEDCSDAEIVGLRTLIEDLCFSEDMREEIPLKWLQFEEARLRNPPVMSVAMVRQILQKSIGDFSNAELLTMLKFYHDIGQILFFDGQTEAHPNLMHMGGILADRCWLIKLFRMFLAVPKLKDQSPAFTRSWKRLNEEGILEETLINHLWSGTLNEIQEWHVGDALDTKQALLSLMCKLDLLCERYSLHQRGPAGDQMETSDVQETTERTYFVPTALHKSSVIKRDPQNPASYFIFYVDFKQIVPESLFNRLVVHALAWSQTQDGTEQLPRIAYRYVCFPADGDHDVEMEMSPLKQAHIKVCVSKHAVVSTSARGPTRLIKSQSTPSPLVMCKVKDFLVATFDAIKSMSAIGLKFGFSIPCPCDPEGSLHFLPLNDCLEKERIGCQLSGVRIDTMGVKQMFADLGTLPAEILDPYVMSEKHLRAVAAELGPEWQHLAVNLGFNQSNLYRFKHDNSIIDNAIFSMLVTWSHREGQDKGKKLQVLSEAMVACGRRDVVETLLHPYM
ncbi:uncharacterized protein LOC110980165 isoform X2 [Acanthaster planci]|nr:uncharacterized protein LOC110980165 isoform X2 [Acanthaster planci]